MVNHNARLDSLFGALGSDTRRRILALLEERNDQSVSDLAEPLGMKLPAMLKQLGVLENARLITRKKSGRTMRVHLAAKPMAEGIAWLQRYERFWSKRLDRLAAFAEQIERQRGKANP